MNNKKTKGPSSNLEKKKPYDFGGLEMIKINQNTESFDFQEKERLIYATNYDSAHNWNYWSDDRSGNLASHSTDAGQWSGWDHGTDGGRDSGGS